MTSAAEVVRLAQLDAHELEALVARCGAQLVWVEGAAAIPGSYWGDSEAGLIGERVFVRTDTPAHSLLHELCHRLCMDDARRARLATDAGGSDEEECAVCYLQILLADELGGFGRERCLGDMDAWGYSFREGSARAWLDGDARFACDWLRRRGLLDAAHRPSF